LCEFLQDVRSKHHAAHAETNCSAAATSRLTGLTAAANLIGAPLTAALADPRVRSAANAREAGAARQEFNIPLALMCIIEDYALGAHVAATGPRVPRPEPPHSDVEVAAARDMRVFRT